MNPPWKNARRVWGTVDIVLSAALRTSDENLLRLMRKGRTTVRSYTYRALAAHLVGRVTGPFRPKLMKGSLREIRALGLFGFIRYKCAPAHGELKIRVHGRQLTVRKGTPDLKTAMSSLGGEFDPLAGYLSPKCDGVIVDAGGYIGTAAIRFSEMFPQATIVTLEPDESNLRILKLNTENYPSIRVVNCALVGIERDWVTIYDSNVGEWGFTTVDASVGGLAFNSIGRSTARTIAQLNLSPISLLKMDIEGAEKEIFEANDLILQKIPVILVELHDRLLPGCSDAFRSFSRNRQTLFDGTEKWYSLGPPEDHSSI